MYRIILTCALALLASLGSGATALDAPQGRAMLVVTGVIDSTNADDAAVFDREMLQSLDWREIETHTSFTEGPQVFAGPTLASLLEALGVTTGTGVLRASAINDYTVEIPLHHAWLHDVLLAVDHNGRPMRIRDKGPIWIVYPLSAERAARQPFDSEMIWQLARLHVVR